MFNFQIVFFVISIQMSMCVCARARASAQDSIEVDVHKQYVSVMKTARVSLRQTIKLSFKHLIEQFMFKRAEFNVHWGRINEFPETPHNDETRSELMLFLSLIHI